MMSGMKIILDRSNGISDIAKEKIGELEETAIGTVQSETQKKRIFKKMDRESVLGTTSSALKYM